MRKKVTSKKAQKETDDADYQLVKVGQNKVPQVGRLQLPKPTCVGNGQSANREAPPGTSGEAFDDRRKLLLTCEQEEIESLEPVVDVDRLG